MDNPYEIIGQRLSKIENSLFILTEEIKVLRVQENGKFISAKEVCRLFNPKISLPTVKRWTDEGYLTRYNIGNRIFYKKDEIMEAVKKNKKFNPQISIPNAYSPPL